MGFVSPLKPNESGVPSHSGPRGTRTHNLRITNLAFGNANHDPSSPRAVPLYLEESVDLMER
jgi:hypothetical protein